MAVAVTNPHSSAAGIWSAVDPDYLSPLLSSGSFQRIRELSRPFQSGVGMAVLECRLAPHEDKPDFSFRLMPSARLAPGEPSPEVFAFPPGDEAWTRAASLLEWWSESGPASKVPFVWYAFDMDHDPGILPLPCISICVDPDFYARRIRPSSHLGLSVHDPATLRGLMEEIHGVLYAAPPPAGTGEYLERCARELTGVGHANHLSFMLSRTPATVKFDVRIRKDAVGRYLRAIGFEGAVPGLEDALGGFMPWSGQVQLNMVLHPRLPRPLEAEFLMVPGEATPGHREGFLEALVDAGLCSPAKADVLLDFEGRPQVSHRDPGLPGHLVRGWYCKILFREDCPVEAKAYLGFQALGGATHATHAMRIA